MANSRKKRTLFPSYLIKEKTPKGETIIFSEKVRTEFHCLTYYTLSHSRYNIAVIIQVVVADSVTEMLINESRIKTD